MILTIHCPDGEIHDYLDVVKHQLDQGFTSGHIDRDAHWSMDDDVAIDPPHSATSLGGWR